MSREPEAGVLLFLNCYQHPHTFSCPPPPVPPGPHSRLLPQGFVTNLRPPHSAAPTPSAEPPTQRRAGCAPGTPTPTFVQAPCGRPNHPGCPTAKTSSSNSRPDFLEGWSSRLSLGRGLGDFCVPSDPEVLGTGD